MGIFILLIVVSAISWVVGLFSKKAEKRFDKIVTIGVIILAVICGILM